MGGLSAPKNCIRSVSERRRRIVSETSFDLLDDDCPAQQTFKNKKDFGAHWYLMIQQVLLYDTYET
jgi:hypothetical protein